MCIRDSEVGAQHGNLGHALRSVLDLIGQRIIAVSYTHLYLPSPETKMPADLKDQLAFLFAHKENALLRFYKYNKYTKHNSIPTKHLTIMFFDLSLIHI